jgi:O-antigen/teichoic acid export membrane protein
LIFIVVILETGGLWFLNNVLDIPDERMFAANIVFQFSVLTFCLNLIRIPYNSIIISYESMNVYAILSILEAFLRLSLVVALKYLAFDKLIAYSVLMFVITLVINAFYIVYCKRNYRIVTHVSLKGNNEIVRKMQGFLGWNLLGGVTGVATNEGPNYFMNYYLGVTVNAAMGIAKQVSGALYQFTANFQTAFNPQIVKAYAADEKEYLFNLINKTSLLSFYLLFIFAFPIILCADYIFELWLINVPQYTVIFCILIILSQMISALASPLWMLAHATGNIKQYQITLSIISLIILPACFFILKLGYPPYYILAFQILLSIIVFIYRLWFAKTRVGFPIRQYLKKVVLKCTILFVIIVPIPLYITIHAETLMQNVFLFFFSFVLSVIVIFFVGLDKGSRADLITYTKKKLHV